MRVIDDKGCLFGKINIIDFSVLVILVWTVGALSYYGIKLTKAPKTPAPVLYSEEKYKQLENNLRIAQQQYTELKASGLSAITTYQMIIAEKDAEITRLNGLINAYLRENKRARRYF